MNKLSFKIILLSFIMISNHPCFAESNIDIVKNGVILIDKSTSVGLAFDIFIYFKSKEWLEDETINKRRTVFFVGEIDLNKLKRIDNYRYAENINKKIERAFIYIGFLINVDNTFEIIYLSYGIAVNKVLYRWKIDTLGEINKAIKNIYDKEKESGVNIIRELKQAYYAHESMGHFKKK